jgi:RNA polymerase sigma factor (sigma-70 family)
VEASAIKHPSAVRGPAPLLRLASDERLVVLTRRGHQAAFEALVARYQSRLLAFCRHMLSSREDAEDVLQEVFAAAFNAMVGDDRPINVRPWLYRIARNRSLNHLRRTQAIGVDSMDIHVADHGATTAEKVHRREDFRMLMADVQTLPESQRTALLLREIDALSYGQIAEAMDTTIPSVKSLLVRARVSLAEAAQARELSCTDVRGELGEVAEGLRQRITAPARRHVRGCTRCTGFRKQLRTTNRALAAVLPVGPLLFMKKAFLAQLGTTASAAGATGGAVAGGTAAGSASMLSAGVSAVASKTAAGLAAAAIVTAGAVEVNHAQRLPARAPAAAVAQVAAPPPVVVAARSEPAGPVATGGIEAKPAAAEKARPEAVAAAAPALVLPPPAETAPAPEGGAAAPAVAPQQSWDITMLPASESSTAQTGGTLAPDEPAAEQPPPAEQPAPTGSQPEPAPAPEQPAPAEAQTLPVVPLPLP